MRANTYLKLGQFQLAIEDCSTAIQLHPISSAAYCTRSLFLSLYICLSLYHTHTTTTTTSFLYFPFSTFNSLLILLPSVERAYALTKLKLLDEAEADCMKAIELNPNDTVIYSNRYNLCLFLYRAGALSRLISLFRFLCLSLYIYLHIIYISFSFALWLYLFIYQRYTLPTQISCLSGSATAAVAQSDRRLYGDN